MPGEVQQGTFTTAISVHVTVVIELSATRGHRWSPCSVTLTHTGMSHLTHWPLGNLDAIVKLQFSISFYWLVFSHRIRRWMPWDLTDDKSALVHVMVWCRQATSHYLRQCWPRSLSPYGVTRPQWVKPMHHWLSHYSALSHYLNKCLLIFIWLCLDKLQLDFTTKMFIPEYKV